MTIAKIKILKKQVITRYNLKEVIENNYKTRLKLLILKQSEIHNIKKT